MESNSSKNNQQKSNVPKELWDDFTKSYNNFLILKENYETKYTNNDTYNHNK